MRKGLLALALGVSLLSLQAGADVLTLPEGESAEGKPAPKLTLPAKGQLMADVEASFGPPRVKQPTVGGGHPLQPPITRWDYDGFSVIFEHDRVVNSVIPGAPPKLKRRDRLQTLPDLAPPPPPMEPAPEEAVPADPMPADAAVAEPEADPAEPAESSEMQEDPEAGPETPDAPEPEQPPVY